MSKKIVITGGTGFVGKHLVKHVLSNYAEAYGPVVVVTRSGRGDAFAALKDETINKSIEKKQLLFAKWDATTLDDEWASHVDGAYAVLHLAGEGIFERRWNDAFKKELLDSRKRTTRLVVDAIEKASVKPQVLVSASGIGYYGDTKDAPVDESSPTPPEGVDFLADICKVWEGEARRATEVSNNATRVAIPRIGIVLDNGGGAMQQIMLPFWLHVGGHVGSGEQYFPWIHMEDAVRGLLYPLESKLEGPYNLVAPESMKFKDFCVQLGAAMNRWSWAHVPWIAARILLGEVANTLVTGQNASPKKLLAEGFKFKYGEVKPALEEIVSRM